MIEELIKYNTDKGAITVQRLCVNLTSMGLYEGINNENIKWNLEIQGHPFGNPRIPILYLGEDSHQVLSDTYCLWILLESEPKDENYTFSTLAVCFLTDRWNDVINQINLLLPKVDYWNNCKDFDL